MTGYIVSIYRRITDAIRQYRRVVLMMKSTLKSMSVMGASNHLNIFFYLLLHGVSFSTALTTSAKCIA